MFYVYGYLLILLRNFIIRLTVSLLQDSFIALGVNELSIVVELLEYIVNPR
jgi:hypothetical protein